MAENVYNIARTASGTDNYNTIVPRIKGWLAVQIYFLGEQIEDLVVKFSKVGDAGQPGAIIGKVLRTDSSGIAKIDWKVPVGNYFCQIEDQPDTIITTVSDPEEPYEVVLPIGRPYFDYGLDDEDDDSESEIE